MRPTTKKPTNRNKVVYQQANGAFVELSQSDVDVIKSEYNEGPCKETFHIPHFHKNVVNMEYQVLNSDVLKKINIGKFRNSPKRTKHFEWLDKLMCELIIKRCEGGFDMLCIYDKDGILKEVKTEGTWKELHSEAYNHIRTRLTHSHNIEAIILEEYIMDYSVGFTIKADKPKGNLHGYRLAGVSVDEWMR